MPFLKEIASAYDAPIMLTGSNGSCRSNATRRRQPTGPRHPPPRLALCGFADHPLSLPLCTKSPPSRQPIRSASSPPRCTSVTVVVWPRRLRTTSAIWICTRAGLQPRISKRPTSPPFFSPRLSLTSPPFVPHREKRYAAQWPLAARYLAFFSFFVRFRSVQTLRLSRGVRAVYNRVLGTPELLKLSCRQKEAVKKQLRPPPLN